MDKQNPASGSGTVPSPPPPAPSPGATREKLLSWSPRRYSVNRFVLVQQPDETKPRPSTVGVLTKGRHHRALVLYLLLLTWWPWLSLRHTPLAAEVWVRALTAEGPGTANALTWSPSTLSRVICHRYGATWIATSMGPPWRVIEDALRGWVGQVRVGVVGGRRGPR